MYKSYKPRVLKSVNLPIKFYRLSCNFLLPSGQNRRKSSLYECILDNIALYFERRINKKRASSDCFFDYFTHWVYSKNCLSLVT